MNVKKVNVKIDKISIELVLCPKTNLYLQNLYCRRCPHFKLDNMNGYIICNYKRLKFSKGDVVKEKLIQEFSHQNKPKSVQTEELDVPLADLNEDLKDNSTNIVKPLIDRRDQKQLSECHEKFWC